MFTVITFYRYVTQDNVAQLRQALYDACVTHQIYGRILIGEEGVNGAVCGLTQEIRLFQDLLERMYPGLTYRVQESGHQVFHKRVVRAREEICAFGEKVDMNNRGEYIEPKELDQWYKDGKDFVIADVRNDYEYKLGHFEGAREIPTKTFREFKDVIEDVLGDAKDKDVVLYCTGGIRCEKASAYLKDHGWNSVRHVKGGVINYVNQFPEGKWEGDLFVFDDRKISSYGAITQCAHCQTKTSQIQNCHNLDCDQFFVVCDECRETFDSSCSEACQQSEHRRKGYTNVKTELAKVTNYYKNHNVACAKVTFGPIRKGMTVTLSGPTTGDVQTVITELRDDDGNIIERAGKGDVITFTVPVRVRKSDVVCV